MEVTNINETPIIQNDWIVGIANRSLTPELITGMGAAFGTTLDTTDIVLVGRDFRYDSRMLKRCFIGGLISTGVSTFDFHAIAGSTLQFLIRRFGASAGVLIAASHSIPKGIEIRIFDELGMEQPLNKLNMLLKSTSISSTNSIRRVHPEKIGRILVPPDVENIYRNALTRMIDTQSISKMNSNLTVDCSLSPISEIIPSLLSELNFKVVSLNSFKPVHIPEVLPNNHSLAILTKSLIATDSDLGIVFDQQGSCVHFIDETGTFIEPSEVATLLAINRIQETEGEEKVVVISEYLGEPVRQAIEDAGAKVQTVDVTTTSLPRAIRKYRAIFGAADDGSYYYPAFSPGRESILTVFYLLSTLAERKQPFSRIVHPYAHQRTDTTQKLAELQEVMTRLGTMQFKEFKTIDTVIGYKFIFPDGGWVHLRPTRIIGKFRLIGQSGENSSEDELFNIVKRILAEIQEKVKNDSQV